MHWRCSEYLTRIPYWTGPWIISLGKVRLERPLEDYTEEELRALLSRIARDLYVKSPKGHALRRLLEFDNKP